MDNNRKNHGAEGLKNKEAIFLIATAPLALIGIGIFECIELYSDADGWFNKPFKEDKDG